MALLSDEPCDCEYCEQSRRDGERQRRMHVVKDEPSPIDSAALLAIGVFLLLGVIGIAAAFLVNR